MASRKQPASEARAPRRVAVLAMLVAATGTTAVDAAPPGPGLHAARMTAENVDRLRVRGPDAIGGLGDWSIGNGTLCAVVTDLDHETVLSDRGGALVDLGHCDQADDQLNLVQPLLNLARDAIVPIVDIRAAIEPDTDGEGPEAVVVTLGELNGVRVETRYALGRSAPDRLRVRTRVTRDSDAADDVYVFGDVVLHGHRQLAPFTLSRVDREQSVGYQHETVSPEQPLSMLEAIVPADVHVLVGGAGLGQGIAYGFVVTRAELEGADGRIGALTPLGISGESFTLMAVPSRPFWFGGGSLGWLEIAQLPFMTVEASEQMVYEREVIVGRRSDVASVTDQLWPEAASLTGRVDEAGARVSLALATGAPVTDVVPEADGRFAVRLAPGRYLARAQAPGGPQIERTFTIEREDVDLGQLALSRHADLVLPSGHAMRLVFRGLDGTSDPRLRADGIVFRVGDEHFTGSHESSDVSLAGTPRDPRSLRLPAGRYRVLATRGPEYDVTTSPITLEAGERAVLEIAPPARLLTRPGWRSADLHVHSAPSDDSGLDVGQRIATFAAQAVDVVVSTEHDRVYDYGPEIRSAGLAGRLDSIIGVEVTSSVESERAPHTLGHANAFPLQLRPAAYRGGAPRGENRRLRDLVAALATRPGRPLLQLNHPRGEDIDGNNGSFLSHLSVAGSPHRPDQPLAVEANRTLVDPDPSHGRRDLDFDAMELLNGAGHATYPLSRADWLSFLLQGEIRTATANSDTHELASVVGIPRNYVRFAADADGGFDPQAFAGAIRAGRVWATTGPLLEVTLESDAGDRRSGIGERFSGSEGQLVVAVDAAPWVPVSRLRVHVNAAEVVARPIAAGDRVQIPLRFATDSFVTLEVEGDVAPDSVYALVAPRFQSIAFTNPIYIDADADGHWRAPGLPSPPPPALTPGR